MPDNFSDTDGSPASTNELFEEIYQEVKDVADRAVTYDIDAPAGQKFKPAVIQELSLVIGGGGGGGGGTMVPDPDNEGYFILTAGSSLTPDPDNEGMFLIGGV